MKRQSFVRSRQSGLSIVEMIVAVTTVAIFGAVLFNMLYSSMILFAKNSAIDVAHQEARVAVLQMEQDIHAAVSIPELTDANRNIVSGSGPTAGISFQLFSAGPFQVVPSTTAYSATQNQISIYTSTKASTGTTYNYPAGVGYTPSVGQRLIIPTHQIELDITGVTMSGTTATLTLSGNLGQAVATTETKSDGTVVNNLNIACFITDRVTYAVSNNQLWYYPRQTVSTTPRLMADYITSATPFSIPATALGAPYYRFVAAINLVTADTAYGKMNFKAANMFLNSMEPYRARLCTYQ